MKNYDQVYVNGKFFTSDEKKLYADAMAVKDGLIAWIGEAAELDTTDEEVVDLQGKRVLPGIIDSHMHPVMLAANQRQIVCLPPYINSIEELIEAIKKARAAQGPKAWIFGWGYDEGKLKEGKTPSRYDLDAGADDVPVCILRSCGHMRCINSKALEMAGINRDTADPEGGEIMKDDQGEPTGVLRENARFLLSDILPKDSEDAVIDNLVMLSEHLVSQGITAVGDMGNLDDTDYYYVYQKARERGFLQRVSVFYMWESFKNISDFQFKPEQLDRKAPVKVSGLKIIADGGISGRTAWCNRPYLGGDGREQGIPTCTEDHIRSAIRFCKKYNAQLAVHAMGQSAIDRAVNVISEVEDWLDSDLPHARIEHASMPTEKALTKAAAADIAFVTQPVFLYAEIERYMENMGSEWLQSTFPVQDIMTAGIRLAFSTDAPATPLADASNPFVCMQSAVTRKAHDGTDCGQYHKVDIETAIRLYTALGQYVMGFADNGMLKPGFAADFIVLDRDILSVPEDTIGQVQVEATYIDGCCVYKK